MTVIIIFVLSLPPAITGQEPKVGHSPKASIDDLKWIAGHWEGEAMGGKFEETWNPPKGGTMVGMFKFIKDGHVNFYEFLTIVPKDETLVLRLKHFSSELVGWEEKDKSIEFPLTSISEKEARFDGLTFQNISPDRLLIVVMNQQKDGTNQELRFSCHRTGQAPRKGAKQAIAQVLAMDSVLSRQRDQLPEKHSLATAVSVYVHGLDSIDFSECPTEFASAFKQHRDAWNDSIPFFEKHDGLHGEMQEVMGKIRQMDQTVVSELDRYLVHIMDSWTEVENIASNHGAD